MEKETKYIFIIIGGIVLFLLIFDVLGVGKNIEEREYQSNLNTINYYKELCENAGMNFEMEGELINPDSSMSKIFFASSFVGLKCYEVRNGIKIYYNLNNFNKQNETGDH